MKRILILVSVLSVLPIVKGQVVLQALEGSNDGFTPSDQCLELVYDKNYGDGDHDFIYCAVKGPGNRIWLNHNLGAEYTRVGSSVFNPQMVPTRQDDENAYGSLFQMGRKADGHELVSYGYDGATPTITRKYPYTTQVQDRLNSNKSFVWVDDYTPYDTSWATNRDFSNLWEGENLNNPCPTGYRLPNYDEVKFLYHASYYDDEKATYGRIVKFKNLVVYGGPSHYGYDRVYYANYKTEGSSEHPSIGRIWVGSLNQPSVEALVYDRDLYEWLPYASSYVKLVGGVHNAGYMGYLEVFTGNVQRTYDFYYKTGDARFSAVAHEEWVTITSMPVRCIKDDN